MLANVQLNGVIRSNSSKDSIVIIATDGGPSRALRLNSEIMPGIVVKSINARSVILSGNGTEHEITLPAFASQDGIVPDTAGLTPQNNANGYRRAPITARAPSRPSAAVPVAATAGSAGASTSETNASGVAGQAATTVPLQAPQIVPPTDANRR